MNRLWSAHGLLLQCDDVALDARPYVGRRRPHVVFEVEPAGEVLAYGERPEGRLMARIDWGEDHPSLTVVAVSTPDGAERVDIHFHGLAVARINAVRDHVALRMRPGADPDFASVLLGGTVMAILLALRGHPVLHASAVTGADGRAVAFVGSSGMGKSTMATLACREGASLLADDVLRVDADAQGAQAWPGATATRLRSAARDLGREVTNRVRETGDQRLAATPVLAPDRAVPLQALVVPMPDRTSDRVSTIRLRGTEAILAMARHPRVLGWSDRATVARAHQHVGDLARTVPIFTARVPWGPPFRTGIWNELLDAISVE